MLDSISSHRLQVVREKKLKEKAELQSKADECRANVEADELFWEEERLKAQKIREEKIRIVNDNVKLAAQRRAHHQQMEATEYPFEPSYLPPDYEITSAATDATRKIATSTQIVEDEQDAAQEEQAMVALMKGPRLIKATCQPLPRTAKPQATKLLQCRKNIEAYQRIEPTQNFCFTEYLKY